MQDLMLEKDRLIRSLIELELPDDLNMDSWEEFVLERQSVLDELGLLEEASPGFLQRAITPEEYSLIEQTSQRVDKRIADLHAEQKRVAADIAEARQRKVRVNGRLRSDHAYGGQRIDTSA